MSKIILVNDYLHGLMGENVKCVKINLKEYVCLL